MAAVKYSAWFRAFCRNKYTHQFKTTRWYCLAHGLNSEHVARRSLDCDLGPGTGLVLPDGERPVLTKKERAE